MASKPAVTKSLLFVHTSDGRTKATFNGMWSQGDLDRMMNKLPRELFKYKHELKKKLDKEKDDARATASE